MFQNDIVSFLSTSRPSGGLSKLQKKTLKSWCNRRFAEGEIVRFRVTKSEATGSILSLRGEYIAEDVMGGEEGGEEEVEGGEEGEEGVEVPVNGVDHSMTSDDAVDVRKKTKKKRSKLNSTTTELEQKKRSKDQNRKRKKSTDTTSESEGGTKRTRTVEENTSVQSDKMAWSQSGCSVETRDNVEEVTSDIKHKKARRKRKR